MQTSSPYSPLNASTLALSSRSKVTFHFHIRVWSMCREGVETFTLNFMFSLNKTCLLELSKQPLTHLKDPPQGWSLRWATEICPWMENSRYDFGRIGERLSLLHRPVLSWKVLCSWDSLNYQPSTWARAAVTDRIKRLGAARINISEDWCLFVTFIQSAVKSKKWCQPTCSQVCHNFGSFENL